MSKIYKYGLSISDFQNVRMPKGAKILTAQFQGGGLFIWAIVDHQNETELRSFQIIGTGNPFDATEELVYISTVQQHGGQLVWHIFEALAF